MPKQCSECHSVVSDELGYCSACGFERLTPQSKRAPIWQGLAIAAAVGAVAVARWLVK